MLGTLLQNRGGERHENDVFEEAVTVDDGDANLGHTEGAFVTGGEDVSVTANGVSILVALCIDADAPVTRQGTIGR